VNTKSILGTAALVLQCFVPLSTSFAAGNLVKIEFCNNFPQMVNFAIAYQQTTGDWMSRGWLNMETRSCYYFDTALRLPVFYFRAQTDAYRDKGQALENFGVSAAPSRRRKLFWVGHRGTPRQNLRLYPAGRGRRSASRRSAAVN
jgi:hypothetical protein